MHRLRNHGQATELVFLTLWGRIVLPCRPLAGWNDWRFDEVDDK